jgi:N-methylhydantoinase A
VERERAAPVVIGVDTGGTFTDVFASSGQVVKLPSTPGNPAAAIVDALRQLGLASGDAVSHGTTVATNAVLERKGARTALITTAGFEDVLEIRRQNRPALYDLCARWPAPLVPAERRFGARERLDYQGGVLEPLRQADAAELIEQMAKAGTESLAICLLFSYLNGEHEEELERLAVNRLGGEFPVSVSHRVAPHYGEYERTSTTVINAYVMAVMRHYLRSLAAGVGGLGVRHLHVMHSNGGLLDVRAAAEHPVQTVLSGPAAGVVGARVVASRAGYEEIITFDMGGTSTDVAVVPGFIEESREAEVAGFPLLMPMLFIETVGAGGGSVARVDGGGGLHVGPESAGAVPGPAAYGSGSAPTVTDATVVLGRLSPRGLLGGTMPLDIERARKALGVIAGPLGLTVEQAAWAVVRLANSNMDRAVRTVSLQRGYDPRRFTLFPFGGAGPLHAAELAEALGIRCILVPPHPGVMAALGLTVPDLQRDFYRTVLLPLSEDAIPALDEAFAGLEVMARDELGDEPLFGAPQSQYALDVRYMGQSFDLRIPFERRVGALVEAFANAYEERYGYAAAGAPIEIVNARLRVTLPRLRAPRLVPPWPAQRRPEETRDVWFGSALGVSDLRRLPVLVVWRPGLPVGQSIEGPALVEQYDSATLIPPGWRATVDAFFNLVMERVEA